MKERQCKHCGIIFDPVRRDTSGVVCGDCKPLHFRVRKLTNEANYRSRKRGLEYDLDVEWVFQQAKNGCPKTGLTFNLNGSGDSTKKKNLLSPSIDRIDTAKGYTKDNCRVVSWWYNMVRNNYSDEETLELCRTFVKHQSEK